MAIFRTRSNNSEAQEAVRKSNVPVDSVETLRRRARQRLLGAVVLVVLGVIAFSLLFDSQPRPIPVDVDISIPDKDKVDKLNAPVSNVNTPTAVVNSAGNATNSIVNTPSSAANNTNASPPHAPTISKPAIAAGAATAVAATTSVNAAASLGDKEEIVPAKPVAKVVNKPEVKKPEPKPETKPIVKTPEKPAAKPVVIDENVKVKAMLEGVDPAKAKELAKTAPVAAAPGAATATADKSERFIVQVGAFAEGDKAREVRLKLERAGLKTYTHVAQTKDGPRTRVRVGPFANREEADKAAAKIKKLDLPAAILTL